MALPHTLLRSLIPAIVLAGVVVATASIVSAEGSLDTRYATSLSHSFFVLVTSWAITSGAGHLFFDKEIRQALGWDGPEFQFELGVLSLSLGLASIVATSGGAASADDAKATLALTWGVFVAAAGVRHALSAQYVDAVPDLVGGLYLVTSAIALWW
jgi:hypothetical protein